MVKIGLSKWYDSIWRAYLANMIELWIVSQINPKICDKCLCCHCWIDLQESFLLQKLFAFDWFHSPLLFWLRHYSYNSNNSRNNNIMPVIYGWIRFMFQSVWYWAIYIFTGFFPFHLKSAQNGLIFGFSWHF